jgi:glyoxylate carboligase
VSVNLNLISSDFELQIKADVKEFLQQYIKATPSLAEQTNDSFSEWLSQIKSIKEEFIADDNSTKCLHSSYVLATLSEYTRKYEPIVVTDVGQHQMLTAQFYNFNKPRKFITSGGLGTMGFGLPAAIGAHIANPDNLVLNITGDGSFQMNLQELATCREHNIPVKIIIMNNGYLGMVRQMQEKIYNNRYQVEMTNPDFVKIAEAYDLFAIRVTNKNELIPAINKAIAHKGTAIVDIMIDSFEEILDSKINRVCIIAKFLEDQSKKFSERQKEIYNEFDMSAKNIIKKSETLRDLIEAFTFGDEENLFDKWLETKPEFDENFLNASWMRNDTLDLIRSVELNVSYTFDEKFFLWVSKNNFSKYLKNNF